MESTYRICRLPDGVGAYPLSGAFEPSDFMAPYDALSAARIGLYPWSDGAYEPEAYAHVGWNGRGLHVLMYAMEPTIRAEETETGGRVCEDSCLEFFFKPFPDADDRYLNIEMNPIGTAHIGLGKGRGNGIVLTELPEGVNITHSAHEKSWWAVSYTVPAALLGELYGGRALRPGHIIRGNFYKCDESLHPHFGCFFPVTAPKPDFHRPECFGEMVLE